MRTAEKLTQQIKAQKVAQGVPEEVAHTQAVATVEKKVSRTKVGLVIVAIGLAGGVTSALLGMSVWLTFGSLIGGCLWGASVWSGELIGESLKNISSAIAGAISRIKGAVTGNAAAGGGEPDA